MTCVVAYAGDPYSCGDEYLVQHNQKLKTHFVSYRQSINGQRKLTVNA